MTTILDRHSGLSAEQVQIAQEQANSRKAKIYKVRASHGPQQSTYRILTEEEVKQVQSYISPDRGEVAKLPSPFPDVSGFDQEANQVRDQPEVSSFEEEGMI